MCICLNPSGLDLLMEHAMTDSIDETDETNRHFKRERIGKNGSCLGGIHNPRHYRRAGGNGLSKFGLGGIRPAGPTGADGPSLAAR